jgi:hypothetical protein
MGKERNRVKCVNMFTNLISSQEAIRRVSLVKARPVRAAEVVEILVPSSIAEAPCCAMHMYATVCGGLDV